jgi:hypothetical protein
MELLLSNLSTSSVICQLVISLRQVIEFCRLVLVDYF